MANLTVNYFGLARRAIAEVQIPVKGSTKIPYGVAVAVDGTSGYAVNADDSTAGYVFIGFADALADNSGGADGAINVTVSILSDNEMHFFEADCASADHTWVGKLLAWSDNHTVELNSSATNHCVAGRCIQVLSATKVIVDGIPRSTANATSAS